MKHNTIDAILIRRYANKWRGIQQLVTLRETLGSPIMLRQCQVMPGNAGNAKGNTGNAKNATRLSSYDGKRCEG